MNGSEKNIIRLIAGKVLWILGGFLIAAFVFLDPLNMGTGFHLAKEEAQVSQSKQLWTCPMHPDMIQNQPGECPICGMTLIPVDSDSSNSNASSNGERKVLFYRNPMNPTITSPVPAKDEMGMDYVPVYEDEKTESIGAPVSIDPSIVQNIGVVTEEIMLRDIHQNIRTVGYLDYDQEKMVAVTIKYSGFVEKVYVNYIGQPVRKGEPLFEVYSPQLIQTEQELLSAIEFSERMKNAPADVSNRAINLVEAARQRLEYWDIRPEQIRKLEETGKVFRTLTVTSPGDGLVMKRMSGLEGMAVQPGMDVIHIAGLTNLWLQVEVFENQLAWINTGSLATITFSYFPGKTFSGRVRFVEPEVSEKTRTVKVTLEVPNRDGKLRAGMYAQVEFSPVLAEQAIAVPNQAVLRTGERNIVVQALDKGRFAPTEVVLGAQGENYVQILSGLNVGEKIVTSAQFLIDSESNLREAINKMLAERQK